MQARRIADVAQSVARWAQQRMQGRGVRVAGLIVSAACLAYFMRSLLLSGVLDDLSRHSWARVPSAFALYMFGYLASAAAWHYLLRFSRAFGPRWATFGIFFTAQFGKYLPGNFAHHIGRVVIADRFGLARRSVAQAMILETAIVLALVLLFSLPTLGLWLQWEWDWIVAVAAGVAILLWRQRLVQIRFAALLPALLLSAIAIVLTGSSLAWLGDVMLAPRTLATVISLFCAAWIVGFLMPGAPAGLGARELILSTGLTPLLGESGALATALMFRVVTTAADLAAFVAGLILLHRARGGSKGAGAPSAS